VLMDRTEKLQAWPNQKDSDIAGAIFDTYGFTPQVDDTGVIHDEAVSTVIQRETDMQFLKRLALRNGYECFVEGDTGFFRLPPVEEETQPLLAAHFGAETTLTEFEAEVDGLVPTNVSMFQVDRLNKEVLAAVAESSTRAALGETDTNGLLGAGMEPGQAFISMNTTTGLLEMEALCQGFYDVAEWFVSGSGTVDARAYGNVLKPRRTVTIKGVGETYSGIYYVNHVNHMITAEGYSQSFQVRRNGIRPTGAEDFAGSSNGIV
jgi:hypothetical protein